MAIAGLTWAMVVTKSAWAAAVTKMAASVKGITEGLRFIRSLCDVMLEVLACAALRASHSTWAANAKAPASYYAFDALGWALFRSGQTHRLLRLLCHARLH